MKFTKSVQDKLDKAQSTDEKKAILNETKMDVEQAGVILEDEELDQASGGEATFDWLPKRPM